MSVGDTSKQQMTKQTGLPNFQLTALPWIGLAIAVGIGASYLFIGPKLCPPQGVLVLGGGYDRETFAAQFAHRHPQLPVWVSGGSEPEFANKVFGDAGVSLQQVHLDYEAVDTITNFTTIADNLKAQGVTSVYLITSDYHMRRATLLGLLIFGSRGIVFQPVTIPSERAEEPLVKTVADGVRALVWLATGRTGNDYKYRLKRTLYSWTTGRGRA